MLSRASRMRTTVEHYSNFRTSKKCRFDEIDHVLKTWEMMLEDDMQKKQLRMTKTKRESPRRWKVHKSVRNECVFEIFCMISDEVTMRVWLSMSQSLREVEEIVRVPFRFQIFESIDTTSVVSFWPVGLLLVDVVHVGTLFWDRIAESVKHFEESHQLGNLSPPESKLTQSLSGEEFFAVSTMSWKAAKTPSCWPLSLSASTKINTNQSSLETRLGRKIIDTHCLAFRSHRTGWWK